MKSAILSIIGGVILSTITAGAETTLFKDDFSGTKLKSLWNIKVRNASRATWTVENGVLKGKAYLKHAGVAAIENENWSNYELTSEFKFNKDSKNMNAGFLFHFMPPGTRNKIYWTGFIFTVLPDKVKLQMVDPVWRKLKYATLDKKIDTTAWHKVKVVVVEEEIKCYLDNKLVISEMSGKLPKGGAGLRVLQGAVTLFKNFSIKEIKVVE